MRPMQQVWQKEEQKDKDEWPASVDEMPIIEIHRI